MSPAARVVRGPSAVSGDRTRLGTSRSVEARLRDSAAQNGMVFESVPSASAPEAGPAAIVRLHAPARAAAPLNGTGADAVFALLAAVAEFAIEDMDPGSRRKTFLSACYGLEARSRREPRLFRSLTLGIAAASAAEHAAALETIERRLRRLDIARLGRTAPAPGARTGPGRREAGRP